MADREQVDTALMKDELSPWNLDHLAPLWPQRVALIDPDRRVSYSYKDLQNRSRSVACFLYERGVRAGDRWAAHSCLSVKLVSRVMETA